MFYVSLPKFVGNMEKANKNLNRIGAHDSNSIHL